MNYLHWYPCVISHQVAAPSSGCRLPWQQRPTERDRSSLRFIIDSRWRQLVKYWSIFQIPITLWWRAIDIHWLQMLALVLWDRIKISLLWLDVIFVVVVVVAAAAAADLCWWPHLSRIITELSVIKSGSNQLRGPTNAQATKQRVYIKIQPLENRVLFLYIKTVIFTDLITH